MRSLAEILGYGPPSPTAEASTDVEDLLGLPPTDKLQASLKRDRATLAAGGLPEWTRARLAATVDMHQRVLRACLQRDARQSERPPGCWCLGLGGRYRAYVPPLDAALADVDELAWFYREHCACDAGQLRAARDAGLRLEAQRQLRAGQLARLWGSAGVPAHFAGWTLESFPLTPATSAAIGAIRAWLPTEHWLLLHGTYGTGKTGLAVGALRSLVDLGHVGLFVTVPDLLARVRQTFGGRPEDGAESDVIDSLVETEVLVLDDLGAERMTGWVSETMFRVINSRHDRHRRTIVTSNFDPPQLANHIGYRSMWRIAELADIIHLDGPNLRSQGTQLLG